jgi:hypothetical protein
MCIDLYTVHIQKHLGPSLPGAGWIYSDPTYSIAGNRNLIRVAVAWSPEHVLPLWGTFTGPSNFFLGMDVTGSVTEEGSERDGPKQ